MRNSLSGMSSKKSITINVLPLWFIAQFKTMVALVVLRERQTLSEISVRFEVSPVVISHEKNNRRKICCPWPSKKKKIRKNPWRIFKISIPRLANSR
jgi:hypothetical protein